MMTTKTTVQPIRNIGEYFPPPSHTFFPLRLVAWLFARRFCSCVNIDADHIFYDIFFWLLSALAVVGFVCILAYPFENFILALLKQFESEGKVCVHTRMYIYAYAICTYENKHIYMRVQESEWQVHTWLKNKSKSKSKSRTWLNFALALLWCLTYCIWVTG